MLITSQANLHIKHIKSLARSRSRQKEGKFIIEGIRFVEEALSSGQIFDTVVYTSKLLKNKRGQSLLDNIAKLNVPLFEVTETIFNNLSGTVNPQGILAVVKEKQKNLNQLLANGSEQLFVLVDGIQDPGNLGTIIRACDAAGADGVFLAKGTVDLYNPKTLRSSMGSIFHLPVITTAEAGKVAEYLLHSGFKLVVGMPQAQKPVYRVNLTGAVVIVVGNEANGVSEKVKALASYKVNIPMPGRAESLNAAVAAAIILYEAVRQRLG